ncbi:MAG TPA: hypothetical protein VFI88_03150 [Sphingomicrobium sp.]|jgi:hypothetical protein|nr:hypothetical protein [Sphingomicrobium sp.]
MDLFEAGELAAIYFFGSRELEEATHRAIAAVEDGTADRAQVRDDSGALIFDSTALSGRLH